ncbi:hypothetical protein OUZ56_032843 [Daphnia magna]|uniref:Uncharacterized protein n=1 Tax=Daphnia magna TaxID=35525 RepID=A0ABR0B9Q0_9CRUS|nr:hypothetical protein OUZ56_032843 [Daphnia magna]
MVSRLAGALYPVSIIFGLERTCHARITSTSEFFIENSIELTDHWEEDVDFVRPWIGAKRLNRPWNTDLFYVGGNLLDHSCVQVSLAGKWVDIPERECSTLNRSSNKTDVDTRRQLKEEEDVKLGVLDLENNLCVNVSLLPANPFLSDKSRSPPATASSSLPAAYLDVPACDRTEHREPSHYRN